MKHNKHNSNKLISIIAIVAVFFTVLALGVYFGVDAPIANNADTTLTQEPVVSEAESSLLNASSTTSTLPSTGYITDAGNVLLGYTVSGTAIGDSTALTNFLNGSDTYGYLTSDISVSHMVSNAIFESGRTLDGNGHTITVTGYNTDSYGAIPKKQASDSTSSLSNTKKDIVTALDSCFVNDTSKSNYRVIYTGGIVAINNGTIKNLKVKYKKYNQYTTAGNMDDNFVYGLIAGANASNGVIENCSVTVLAGATVKLHGAWDTNLDPDANHKAAGLTIGGITGLNAGTVSYSTVNNYGFALEVCHANSGYVGGVVGANSGGTIEYCIFGGTGHLSNGVNSETDSATGGIFGIASTNNTRSNGLFSIQPGTIEMVYSGYKGSYASVAGTTKKPLGMVGGLYWGNSSKVNEVGWFTYYKGDVSINNTANTTLGVNAAQSVSEIIGHANNTISTLYGGRVFVGNISGTAYWGGNEDVYFDYWTQSDRLYMQFDNAASISEINTNTQNGDTKVMEVDTTNMVAYISRGSVTSYRNTTSNYYGVRDINYTRSQTTKMYDQVFGFGGAAFAENDLTIPSGGTLITSTTQFPLNSDGTYYLLGDVYINLETHYHDYDGAKTNFSGTLYGNGHTIYFTTNGESIQKIRETTSSVGIISDTYEGGDIYHTTFAFADCKFTFKSNSTEMGILCGRGNLANGNATSIYGVKFDIHSDSTVKLYTGNTGSTLNAAMLIGVYGESGPTTQQATKIGDIWYNIDGILSIDTDGAGINFGSTIGKLTNSMNSVASGANYFIMSGSGKLQLDAGSPSVGSFIGCSDGGHHMDKNQAQTGTIGINGIYWNWNWNVTNSAGTRRSLNPNGNSNSFASSYTSYVIDSTNGGSTMTATNTDYSSYYSDTIYQYLGGAGVGDDKAGVYGDTSYIYSSLGSSPGTKSTIVRHNQMGYHYSGTTLKLNVGIANKYGMPIGLAYTGSNQTPAISNYVLVPSGYASTPADRKAKVAQISNLGSPASITNATASDVGNYSVGGYTIPNNNYYVASQTIDADFVIYPTQKPTIDANSIEKGWDGTNTLDHSYIVDANVVKMYYSTTSDKYTSTSATGENLALWLDTASIATKTLNAYYKNGTVVEAATHYVMLGRSLGTTGEGGTAVVSGGYILISPNGGKIVVSDISKYEATVIMSNGSITEHLDNGDKITVDYNGSAHTVASVTIPMLGNAELTISYGAGDNVNVNMGGIDVTCTNDSYVGTFTFTYYIVPKQITISNVHAVYDNREEYTLNTSATNLTNTATEASDYAIATVEGLAQGDSLSMNIHYGADYDTADYSNANAGIDGVPFAALYAIYVDIYYSQINSSPYWVVLTKGDDGEMVPSNYCIASNILGSGDEPRFYAPLLNGNIGYIRRRVVAGLSDTTELTFKAKEQKRAGGVLTSTDIKATAQKTANNKTTFSTVYRDGYTYNASAEFLLDENNTPVAIDSSFSATNVGEYAVQVRRSAEGNYVASNNEPVTVYFTITQYALLVSGITNITYGTESLQGATTSYTYTAYEQEYVPTWDITPSWTWGDYNSYVGVGTYYQDISITSGASYGNYSIPYSQEGHSLVVGKATVYVRAADNIAKMGNIASTEADHSVIFLSGFKNGDTKETAGVSNEGALQYDYTSEVSNTSERGSYENVIRISNVSVLTADNYTFEEHPSDWGDLTIKEGIYAVSASRNNFSYNGEKQYLVLDSNYQLNKGLSWNPNGSDVTDLVEGVHYDVVFKNTNGSGDEQTSLTDAGTYSVEFVTKGDKKDECMITGFTIVVAKAAATITAKPHTAYYGDEATSNSGYVVSGLKGSDGDANNQSSDILGTELTYIWKRADGSIYQPGDDISSAGISYTITPVAPSDHANYTFSTVVSNVLTIEQRVVEVEWYLDASLSTPYPADGVEYNGEQYTLYPKMTNTFAGDNIVIQALANYSGTDANTYNAILAIDSSNSGTKQSNYQVAAAGYSWVINRKLISITADEVLMQKIEYKGEAGVFSLDQFELTDSKKSQAYILAISGEIAYLNAGNYNVELTIEASSNYIFDGGASTTIEYQATILKKVLNITADDIRSIPQEYTGNDITFGTDSFSSPDNTQIATVTNNVYLNAGDYTASVTIAVTDANNYCIDTQDKSQETYSVLVTITPQIISIPDTYKPTAEAVWDVDGVEFGVGLFTALAHTTIQSSTSATGDKYTTANTYNDHVIVLEADTNYAFSGGVATHSLTVSVVVLRASIDSTTITITQEDVVSYTGSAISFGPDNFGALTYMTIDRVSNNASTTDWINAGNKLVDIRLATDANHCFDGEQTKLTLDVIGVSVTVSKAVLNYTQEDIKQATIDYTETGDLSALIGRFSDPDGCVAVTGVVAINGETYSEVGTASVHLELEIIDSNYCFGAQDELTATLENYVMTISKLQVSLSSLAGYATIEQVYNGSRTYEYATNTVITSANHYQATAKDNNATDYYVKIASYELSTKDVGERQLRVYFSLQDAVMGNYEFADGINYVDLDITITKATLTVSNIEATTKTYDGTTDVEIQAGYSVIGIKQNDNVNVILGTGIASSADAGSRQVDVATNAQLIGTDLGNYDVTYEEVLVTISPYVITSVNWTLANTYTYGGGKKPSATFTDRFGNVSNQVEISYSGAGTEFVDAGTYTATAVSTDGNYVIEADSIELEMLRYMFDYDASLITTTPSVTYTGQDIDLTQFGAADFTNLTGIAKYEASGITNQDYRNVGSPQVTLTLTVDKNHIFVGNQETRALTVNITITKATPTLTSPTATPIVYLETIAQSTLTGGSATFNGAEVAGSFAWMDDTSVPDSAGNKQFMAVFTPSSTDTYEGELCSRNFTTNTILVTVVVNKATPSISTYPTASSIYYGEKVGDSILSGGVASVSGSFAWHPDDAIIEPNGGEHVGEYRAVFTPAPEYAGNYKSVDDIYIAMLYVYAPQAELVITVPSITYGVQLKDITLSGTASYDNKQLGGTFSWATTEDLSSYPTVTASVEGKTYKVVWTPEESDANNYSPTEITTTITVVKRELRVSGTVVAIDKEYDGDAFAYVEAVGESDMLDIDKQSLGIRAIAQYNDKHVGGNKDITVTYTLSGSSADNYQLPAPAIYGVKGSITAKVVEVEWQDVLTYIYNGAEQSVTATVTNLIEGDELTLQYQDNAKTNHGSWTAEIVGIEGTTDYTVAGAENLSVAWTIEQKGVELVWTNSNLTYNGEEQSVTATVRAEDIVAGDSVQVTSYDGSNVATNAGNNYIAIASGLDNDNYKIINNSCKYTIARLKIDFLAEPTVELSKEYSGTMDAQVLDQGTTNIIDIDVTLTVTASYPQSEVGDNLTITLSYALGGEATKVSNYELPDVISYVGSSIEAKKVILSWSTNSLVYNGKNEAKVTATVTNPAIVAGQPEVVKVTYLNNSNVAKDAGTYTATAEIKNTNYILDEINASYVYTITPAILTDATATPADNYYNVDKTVSLDVEFKGFVEGESQANVAIYYGTSQNDVNLESSPSFREVGSYTVYYRVESDNYMGADGNALTGYKTINILKAIVSIRATNKVFTKVYDGTTAVDTDQISGYYTVSSNGTVPSLTIINTPVFSSNAALVDNSITVTLGLDNDKYQFDDKGASITINARIEQALVELSPNTSAPKIIKVYDGTKAVDLAQITSDYYTAVAVNSTIQSIIVTVIDATYTSPMASDSNNVKVTFELQDSDNFTFKSDYINLAGGIEKATVTITKNPSYTGIISKVYDGDDKFSNSLADTYVIAVNSVTTPIPTKAIYVKSALYNSANVLEADTLTVQFGNNDSNYKFSDGGDQLTFDSAEITARPVSVTVNAPSIVYGNLATFSYVIANAISGDVVFTDDDYYYDCDYDLANNRNAGTYGVNMIIDSNSINANYQVDIVVDDQGNHASLTVTKAPLTVQVEDVSLNYNQDKPSSFSVKVTGLIKQDTLESLGSITYTCGYQKGDAVDRYPIEASGLDDTNYKINYVTGYIIVTQTVITVVAKDVSIEYGDDLPLLDNDDVIYYSDYANKVTMDVGNIEGKVTYKFAYKKYGNIGEYAITPEVNNIHSDNYAFTPMNGTMSVTARPITVTAGDVTQVYGYTQVNLSLSKYYNIDSGSLVNGDRLDGSMSVDFGGASVPQVKEGGYVIERGTLGNRNTNYNITFVNGRYMVEARQINITLQDQYLNDGESLDQEAYVIRSGEVVGNDDLKIRIFAVEQDALQGTLDASYSNSNYQVTFKQAFFKYGKEDSQIIYNNAHATSITISIPYDGKPHVIDVSCTSGEPVIIQYGGYEIVNSFTDVNVYELLLTAKESNTHRAPEPVSVTLRIYYENLSTSSGVSAVISSSKGFERYDKFAVTAQDKDAVDLSGYLGENQTIVEQYAITLKDADNNSVVIADGKLVLDVPNAKLVENGKVTVLVCEKGTYRLVTADVIDIVDQDGNVVEGGAKQIVLDVKDGIEQIAFVQHSSTFDIVYVGLGVLIALAAIGAIIALIAVFVIGSRKFFKLK